MGYGFDVVQKRYTSAAAVEGFADYVASLTFNRRTDEDCVHRALRNVDFDGDNVADTDGSDRHYSCEALPLDLNSDGDTSDFGEKQLHASVSDGDWLASAVAYFPDCDPPLANRSTKYDWHRFFWDLSHLSGGPRGSGGIHPDDVATIYDLADPKDWLPGDGSPTDPDMPGIRILDACAAMGESIACNNQLFNGISHGSGW